ncbi:MAG: hypothetical protein IT350_16600 [Deltaproteobacteria bacterium]|nr:hypothetical protein [Deltaproteobacteria bacterium]
MSERPTEPAGESRRAHMIAAAVTIASIFVAAGGVTWWNAQTQPVFAARPHSVLGFVAQNATWPDYATQQHAPRNAPIMRAAARGARAFGGSYAAQMLPQTALLAVLIAVCAWIAARVAGPFAAGLAAIVCAVTPANLLAALAFDDQLFNMTATAIVVALLVEATRTGRAWIALVAGGIGAIVWRFAFVPSNGVLALGCVACACTGMFADLAVARRAGAASASTKARLARPWVVAMAAFVAALAGGIALGEFARELPLDYYSREAINVPAAASGAADTARGLALYAARMWRTDLGPVLCAALVLGAIGLARSGSPHRFGLLAWLVVPLVVLSAIPKKNAYYILPALAAVPIVIGAGIAAWPRVLRILAGAACVLGAGALSVAWFTGLVANEPLSGEWTRHFQEAPNFSPGPPQIGAAPEAKTARALVDDIRRARPDDCPRLVIVAPGNQTRHFMNALTWFVLDADPRIALAEIGHVRRVPFEDGAPLLVAFGRDEMTVPPIGELNEYALDQSRGESPFGRSGAAQYLTGVLSSGAPREVARTERYTLWSLGAAAVATCPSVVP